MNIQPSRRDFLKIFLASAATSTFDYEKLLWIPQPFITVPAPAPSFIPLNMSAIIEIELNRLSPYMSNLFERDNTFYTFLTEKLPEVK